MTVAYPRAVPGHVPDNLVHDWDYLADAELLASGFPAYDRLARERPDIFWSPLLGGYWVVTKGEWIREGYLRHDLFSSDLTGLPPITPAEGGEAGGVPGTSEKMLPSQLDPPEHGRYRQILTPIFSPGAANNLTDFIRTTASELIDSFVDDGRCELLDQFARPLPTAVFLRLFGLPPDMTESYLGWIWGISHAPDPDARAAAGGALSEYLVELIAERRRRPGDDVMSQLCAASVDDRPLDDNEVFRFAFLLFLAGIDTVSTTLGFSLLCMAHRPELQARLRSDPGAIPNAVEELLRAHSFINDPRRVRVDTEFHGVSMREGDLILLPTAIIGRDPEVFEDPTQVDFDRDAHKHAAFGAGVHRCLGMHLARREVVVALEELARRLPEYGVAPDAEIRRHGGMVMGIDSLPIVW